MLLKDLQISSEKGSVGREKVNLFSTAGSGKFKELQEGIMIIAVLSLIAHDIKSIKNEMVSIFTP